MKVTEGLKKRGYMAEGIHGDLSQQKRDSVIRQFREGTIDILVATDVAARGLDISGVSHVYNYDMPQDPESYTHRVGRTGRAGKAGQAFTFVIPREMEHLHAIERLTKRKIARRRAPSLGEVLEGQQRLAIESLVEMTDNLEALAPFKSSAEELLNDTDSVTLLAAALKLLTKEPDTTPVNITEEKPLRVRVAVKVAVVTAAVVMVTVVEMVIAAVTEIVVAMTALVAAVMTAEVNVVMTAAEMIVDPIVHVVIENLVIKVKVSNLTLKTNRMWIAYE